MAKRIQFREEQMKEAINFMRQYAKELNEIKDSMINLGGSIQGQGALIGNAGEALQTAVTRDLCGALEKLRQRFDEEAKYVETELQQLKQAAQKLR